jgi:hypothetical protein
MNRDKIDKIALECGAFHQVYGDRNLKVTEYFNYHKFAELIVNECMQIVHNGINNATDWDSSSWDQCCENRMYAIQSHFGVVRNE